MATGTLSSQAIAYLKPELPPEKPTRKTRETRKTRKSRPSVELSGGGAPVLRILGNGLLIAYVVDTGEQLTWVQHHHLAQEGCSEEELHATGIANLTRLASESLEVVQYPNTEMFVCLMGGNFEASLILLDDLWDRAFRQCVSGDYVVAIPARDLLAFCDASSESGLTELKAAIERAQV